MCLDKLRFYTDIISGRSQYQWPHPREKTFWSMVPAEKRKCAERLASTVTLACAFLLVKKFAETLHSAVTLAAAISGGNATLQQQQQVREWIAQLRQRPISSTEWRMSLSLAWPLHSTQLHFASSRSHDLSAPAPRCHLRPGTPQVQRWAWRWRHRSSFGEAAFKYSLAEMSSYDITFPRKAAASFTSLLGCRFRGSCHTAPLT